MLPCQLAILALICRDLVWLEGSHELSHGKSFPRSSRSLMFMQVVSARRSLDSVQLQAELDVLVDYLVELEDLGL